MPSRNAVTPSGNSPPASRRSRSDQSVSVRRTASKRRAVSSSVRQGVDATDIEAGERVIGHRADRLGGDSAPQELFAEPVADLGGTAEHVGATLEANATDGGGGADQ